MLMFLIFIVALTTLFMEWTWVTWLLHVSTLVGGITCQIICSRCRWCSGSRSHIGWAWVSVALQMYCLEVLAFKASPISGLWLGFVQVGKPSQWNVSLLQTAKLFPSKVLLIKFYWRNPVFYWGLHCIPHVHTLELQSLSSISLPCFHISFVAEVFEEMFGDSFATGKDEFHELCVDGAVISGSVMVKIFTTPELKGHHAIR